MKQKILGCLLLAVVVSLLGSHTANAAANITISSATLASNGETLTATISGGSGTGYSPASGVTGITVRTTTNVGADYPIASATVSGSTLTVTLGAIISSDDTVVVDLSSSSNLTDSGSNTATGQTAVSVTNGSTHAATRYAYNNSAIQYYGRLTSDSLPTYEHFIDNTNSEADFVINGTDATAMVLFNSAHWEVSVDGGSYAAISPSISVGTNIAIPLFSGLSAADHTVSLKEVDTTAYLLAANSIQVFGGTEAIRAPGATDGQGYGPSVKIFSGANYVDPGSWLPGTEYSSPTDGNNGYTGEWSDATARVKGHGTNLYVWIFGVGVGQLAWEIDGVEQTPFAVPSTGAWGWYKIASGLDQSTDHIYTVKTDSQAVINYIDAFMFSGTSAAFSSSSLPAQPGLGGFGDSITAGAGLDSTAGWFNTLAQENGLTPYNRGWGGTLVESGSGAGEGRTSDITGISPALSKVTVMYGTNDLTASGNGSTPTSAFGSAYQTMLTDLLNGTTSTKFYVIGILPRTGYSSATIAAWNGTGNGVLGSVEAVQAALPSSASRLIYVNSATWNLNGTSGTDYTTNYLDGLHPNTTGSALIANDLNPYIASTGYTATGPSSGLVSQASTNFTVTIAQGSTFNGNESITLSDGGNGGTFTPSVGSSNTSSVTVTPTTGSTNFTFTYTPASSGTKTLTLSNGQGWSDPSAITYSATSAVPSVPTQLSVTTSANETVAVSWSAPASNGGSAITDYTLQYRLTGTSSWTSYSHTPSPATTMNVTGIWGGPYDFQVAAVNGLGTGSFDTISDIALSSGGGGGGGSTPSAPTVPTTPTVPVVPSAPVTPTVPTTPSAPQVPVSNALVNVGGTYFLIEGTAKYGITDPGILASYGYTFSESTPATTVQVALPITSNLPPNSGALVKTVADPTVYLISGGQRFGFASANVFTALGYNFSSVLTVTTPELDLLSVAAPITNGTQAHPSGANVLLNGTVYYVGTDNMLHPYPSLAVYNTWNIPNDFSTVVPANTEDQKLPIGIVETARI